MPVFSKPSFPLPLTYFNRDRQILTRSQERCIRTTFHFLSLPAELRNIIYELSVNLDGVEKWFDDTYAEAAEWAALPANRDKVMTRTVERRTPTIFLICRQIYAESIILLGKRSVSFHHGLFTLTAIRQIMSETALQRVTSIKITTKGHGVLKPGLAGATWKAYIILLKDLARILSGGHNLKILTIDLQDPDLSNHLLKCWHSPIECDYRDHVKTALNRFRPVRGIGYVDIKGVDPAFAFELKTLLETKRFPFLNLPGEVRNRIYQDCIDYDDISTHISRVMQDWETTSSNHRNEASYPTLSTPTILLLNKQIHHEAKAILAKKPLTIICPSKPDISSEGEIPSIFRFISAPTIQAVTKLHIHMHSWQYAFAVEHVLRALKTKHSLQSFHFKLIDNLKADFLGSKDKAYPDGALARCLRDLANIHDVKDVVFEGDIPSVYTEPMMKIMTNKRSGKKSVPKAIRGDGKVVDVVIAKGGLKR